MTDPISDMLTRIRNAQAVGHQTVIIPFSRIKLSLAEILANEKYINSVSKKGRGYKREIELVLNYKDSRKERPLIKGLKRISKPGKRIYADKKELGQFLKEQGIVVLSTSQGLMTTRNARKKGIGGEVLCKIW